MSVKWMTHIWEKAPYQGSRLLMLLAIADHANDDGIAWPSVSTLAAKTRVTKRYANLILADLRRDGCLIVTDRPGTSNLFRLKRFTNHKPTPEVGLSPDAGFIPTPEAGFIPTPEAGFIPPLRPTSAEPPINHQVEPSIEPSTTTTPPAGIDKTVYPGQSDRGGVVRDSLVGLDGYEWPITQICEAAGQVANFENQDKLKTFMSYWLYALTQSSINNPIAYAKAQVRKGNRPAQVYQDIVTAGPARLFENYTETGRSIVKAAGELLRPMIGLNHPQPAPETPEGPQEAEPLYFEPSPRVFTSLDGNGKTPLSSWEYVKSDILENEMPKAAFETHVLNVGLFDYQEDNYTLIAQNNESAAWVESRLSRMIERYLSGVTNRVVTVSITTPEGIQ